MIWFTSLLISFAYAKGSMNKVATCKAEKGAKMVWLIKQWHLSPKTVTKGFKEKYPQEKNQTAIYQKLNDAAKKKKVQLVVAEGCEGEIDKEFKTAFNGWDFETLKKQSQSRGYDRIVSHVPLKLEARHGDKLRVLCGDKEDLIQEGNLRISNLRGWMGFWARLGEYKEGDEKSKLYAEAAADLLKVPKETPVAELKIKIRERIKEELDLFQKSLTARNDEFLKVLKQNEFQTAAVVIGGLHAKDLRDKIEAAGLACEVYEPAGYRPEDEALKQDFEKALKD